MTARGTMLTCNVCKDDKTRFRVPYDNHAGQAMMTEHMLEAHKIAWPEKRKDDPR